MYILIKCLQNILLKTPEPLLLIFGRSIGFVFYCIGSRRRAAFKNIKSVFPKKTNKEINAIVRRNFSGFGLSLVESLVIPKMYKHITLTGKRDLLDQGGICVGIHAGSWELINCYFAKRYKFAIMAQEQKHSALDDHLIKTREAEGMKVCFSLKELVKSIKDKYLIGMVVDHGVRDDALTVKFFSHLVPTPRGAVYLARKFKKKIFPCFSYRGKGFSFKVRVGEPIDVEGKTDAQVLTYINYLYEEYLKKNPWEYYWCYKRFKYKINRDVVILSDSKVGHLKQSKALAAFLSQEPYEVKTKIIDVNYKAPFMRTLADILAFFTPRHCPASWFWLYFLLDKKTLNSLKGIYADTVISTGSMIAPVNKLFSAYLGAKSGVVLRPNIPLRKFNLAIIPEHDRVYAENALLIKGALFYPENINQRAKECRDFFKLDNTKKIAFFIGGPVGTENEFFKNFKIFIKELKSFALANDYNLLISTSRRTPEKIEDYLESQLKDFSKTEVMVIANRDNYDFIFEGFNSLADLVFVTSESISMITEIASMGKPCICTFFEPQDNKRELFLNSIKDEISFLKQPYKIDAINFKAASIFEKNKQNLSKYLGLLT